MRVGWGEGGLRVCGVRVWGGVSVVWGEGVWVRINSKFVCSGQPPCTYIYHKWCTMTSEVDTACTRPHTNTGNIDNKANHRCASSSALDAQNRSRCWFFRSSCAAIKQNQQVLLLLWQSGQCPKHLITQRGQHRTAPGSRGYQLPRCCVLRRCCRPAAA